MIDISQLQDFARRCEACKADLKPYVAEFLKDAGEEFLNIVQDAIKGAGNVDTGRLLSSFTRGGNGNIWKFSDSGSGLNLTIGTNVEYAKWVNDGHRQQPGRFIPGYMNGEKFVYQAGCSTGIVLKASFVKGSHFFDKSIEMLERMFPEMAYKSFEQFFQRYFP